MVITEVKQALNGVMEITPEAGPAFFLRPEYLPQDSQKPVRAEDIICGSSFDEAQELDLLSASLVFSVEKAAMSYLARSEHCRAGLKRKLLAKGMPDAAVDQALDYLQSVHYLDDLRFAGAWLRNRAIDHYEGRVRVTAELSARGVERHAVKQAVDEFFEDNDEEEICRRALKKVKLFKKDDEKIKASLVRSGFSFRLIKTVMDADKNCP